MDYSKINWDAAVQNSLSDFEKSKNQSSTQRGQVDLTKYFTLTLPDKVNKGEKIFRILPLTNGTDQESLGKWYTEAKFHSLKIGNRWVKLYDPAQDGEASPLTELYHELMKGDKDSRELAKNYKPKSYYIIRGIERGKEHEGVKFWRFSNTDDGIIQKLIPIITRLNNKKSGEGAIWRPDIGRDLIITLSRDKRGYVIATSIIADDPSVLSEDPNQTNAWIGDTLTWKDIFRKKPLDYLNIIADGAEPIWDQEQNKFIPKVDSVTESTGQSKGTYQDIPQTDDELINMDPIEIDTDDLPF